MHHFADRDKALSRYQFGDPSQQLLQCMFSVNDRRVFLSGAHKGSTKDETPAHMLTMALCRQRSLIVAEKPARSKLIGRSQLYWNTIDLLSRIRVRRDI